MPEIFSNIRQLIMMFPAEFAGATAVLLLARFILANGQRASDQLSAETATRQIKPSSFLSCAVWVVAGILMMVLMLVGMLAIDLS